MTEHNLEIEEKIGMEDQLGEKDSPLPEGVVQTCGIIDQSIISTDGGILTAYILISMPEGQQAFGGIKFHDFNIEADQDRKNLFGYFIASVMNLLGVVEFSQVVKKPVRVLRTNERILAIGHMTEERWVLLKEFL